MGIDHPPSLPAYNHRDCSETRHPLYISTYHLSGRRSAGGWGIWNARVRERIPEKSRLAACWSSCEQDDRAGHREQ